MSGFSCEPLQVREPELDERPHRLLEPCLAGQLEGLLIALAHLDRVDALLQPVVTGDKKLLNPGSSLPRVHKVDRNTHSCDRSVKLAGSS